MFKLFAQYRGKCSDQYARALHNIQAPCRVIMTLRKLKTVLPSLKPPVEWSLRSDVIYQLLVRAARCAMLARLTDICYIASRNIETGLNQ